MTWEELLDITPGMWLALNRQRKEADEKRIFGFKFLATVVAQSAGRDVNFMPEGAQRQGWTDGDGLAGFFEARRVEVPVNGGDGKDSDQATEGTPGGDEIRLE